MRTPRGVELLRLAVLVLGAASAVRAGTLVVPGDHPTIQAAVDAADTGDEILILGGVYEEAVVIQSKTGLLVRGKGKVTIRPGPAATGIAVTSCTDITLKDLVVDRAYQSIVVSAGTEVTLTRCTVSKSYSTALKVTQTAGQVLVEDCRVIDGHHDGIDVGSCPAVTIRDCDVQCLQGGVSVSLASHVLIQDNSIITTYGSSTGNLGAGIELDSCTAAVSDDVKVSGNRVQGGHGMTISSCAKALATGNTVLDATAGGLLVQYSNACIIDDNIIGDVLGAGLHLKYSNDLVVTRNIVRATSGTGVLVDTTFGLVFNENLIQQAGWDGLELSYADDGTYSGNQIKASDRVGLHVGSSSNGNTFSGNVVKGSGRFDLWNAAGVTNEFSGNNHFGTTGP